MKNQYKKEEKETIRINYKILFEVQELENKNIKLVNINLVKIFKIVKNP